MDEAVSGGHTPRNRWMRVVLLALALLTSPALCCGGLQVLDSLPESSLPPSLDFTANLFENSARVEHQTSETLYITAITTTRCYFQKAVARNLWLSHYRLTNPTMSCSRRDAPYLRSAQVPLRDGVSGAKHTVLALGASVSTTTGPRPFGRGALAPLPQGDMKSIFRKPWTGIHGFLKKGISSQFVHGSRGSDGFFSVAYGRNRVVRVFRVPKWTSVKLS